MLTRRLFLGLSSAALASFALDPERLLWRPGAKTIFLPSVAQVRFFLGENDHYGQIVRGRPISASEYNRVIGRSVVWVDEAKQTTVTFPQVVIADSIAPRRRTATFKITVPSDQTHVVSLGVV